MSRKEKIREILTFASETEPSCPRLERSVYDDTAASKLNTALASEPTVVKFCNSEATIKTYPDLTAIDPSLVHEESKKRRKTHKRIN